jgi:hypothetical protein
VVTQSHHVSCAAGFYTALGVWGTHVGGEFADDVADCHFVLDHLGDTQLRGDIGETVMTEGVGSDLVTLSNHTLDQTWVGVGDINLSLAVVVASDEKGCGEVVRFQDIQKLLGVLVWSIVVGESDDAFLGAVIDFICIGNRPIQGTSNSES